MRRWPGAALVAACFLVPAGAAAGPRLAVLNQVDLPHNYYWRELYLPQLTTGPSAVAFLPDGQELIYSMAGSLWRQRIGEDEATELTHADAAYDYQPDVAPDGGSVVFTRYDGRAMELWRLDLASGREMALTSNGGVNVEPRIAPDGKRIVYVSTGGTGHFDLRIAELGPAGLANERFLVAPRKSAIPRYYYSQHDHAINPSWSPDGKCVWFVSNAEVPWGTGYIRAIAADGSGGDCGFRNSHREETTWAARPEVGPDGKRILFSSYHGREWHQLWLTTTSDAAPLALTYGDFDRRNARWSPDGSRVAYISNQDGNTSLWVQDFFGGARQPIVARERHWHQPMATVDINVVNAAGQSMNARVSVLGSDKRWHAPPGDWMHGDEAFDRDAFPSEPHYFHCISPCRVTLPSGSARVVAQRGFRYQPRSEDYLVPEPDSGGAIRLTLESNELPAPFSAATGADLHVHMNYGGNYRATRDSLFGQMEAEDLDVVHNLIVNKEERIPDVASFGDDRTGNGPQIYNAQEFHTSLWGHLGVLHLSDRLLLPDYAAYRHTALTSPWPHNGAIADLAHAQGGLIGYAHPFDTPVDLSQPLTYELPADVANGKLDYLEVMGFSDHHITAGVWHRLLNLGFRVPAGAGTDAMTNYASLRGPIGLVRVFLDVRERTPAALRQALKEGRGFITNGPLLGLEIEGARPGDTLAQRKSRLGYRVSLRSPLALEALELVQNGKVIRRFRLAGSRKQFDASGAIAVEEGGWILLRAYAGKPDPLLFDLYPYATTNPVWLAGPAPPAPEDATYFVAWMDRVIEGASARDDWNDDSERRATLEYLEAARNRFRELAKRH